MILGPVTLVDCFVFVCFLVPQLIIYAGFVPTLVTGLRSLPFLLITLPGELIKSRSRQQEHKTTDVPGGERQTLFQEVIIRCVHYGFQYIPPNLTREFFARRVAMPFLRFRLLRHGYFKTPFNWREVSIQQGELIVKGTWVKKDPFRRPGLILYYLHGGGFNSGSSYFYVEFILSWLSLLEGAGIENPAAFILEYSLVPDARYPKQLLETIGGYQTVLDVAGDPSKVCIAGDSAGALLATSLLLELEARRRATRYSGLIKDDGQAALIPTLVEKPRMAILISPWLTLVTHRHRETSGDFLNCSTLWEFAVQYAGADNIAKAPASPGTCDNDDVWANAAPSDGYLVTYSSLEMLAPDAVDFIRKQRRAGVDTVGHETGGAIHVWPVVAMYLGHTQAERLEALKVIVSHMRSRLRAI